MGVQFDLILCYELVFNINIRKYIMSKILFTSILVVAVSSSLSAVIDNCPGRQTCQNAKCYDFDDPNKIGNQNPLTGEKINAEEEVDCEGKCNWCPLCTLLWVKPGCDFCKNPATDEIDVGYCKNICEPLKITCAKCKKFCNF